jgi:hypothetical protein
MYKGIRDDDHSTDSAGWGSNLDKDEFFSVLEAVQAGSGALQFFSVLEAAQAGSGALQFSYSMGAWSSLLRSKGAGAVS